MALSRGFFSGIRGGDVDVLQVLEGVVTDWAARHRQSNRVGHRILGTIFRVTQCSKLTQAGTVVEGVGLQLKKSRLQAGESRGNKYRCAAQHAGCNSKHLAV